MRIITIVNQKGGCGKTTAAINLAAVYAARGQRTLVVDMDPQAHCAAGLGVPESQIECSIGDALLAAHRDDFESGDLVWEVGRNLHLAPSTVRLAGMEAPGGGLHSLDDRDRRLSLLLNRLADQFDLCLVDCPPTIGLLTFNALRAARETLVPVETGYFSMRGAEKQWATIQRTIAHLDRPIACHMLATLHNPESKLSCDILSTLRRRFAGQIIPVVIREHEALREATSYGQSIMEFAPESEAQHDFEQLADWLDAHGQHPPATEVEVTGQRRDEPAPVVDVDSRHHVQKVEPAPTAREAASLSTRAAELAERVRGIAQRNAQHGAVVEQRIKTTLKKPEPPSRSTTTEHDTDAPAPQVQHKAPDRVDAPEHSSPPDARPFPPSAGHSKAGPISTSRPPLRKAAQANIDEQADVETARQRLRAVYGVRQTRQGVIFVQPAEPHQKIYVAGDFNHWSPTVTPLNHDAQLGVAYTIVPIPPGRYQYRLIIDGTWQADPHNDQQQHNNYGEPNSVFVVPLPTETTDPHEHTREHMRDSPHPAGVISHPSPSP